MGNPATLQPNVFSSTNQPENRGRPKGVRNRSTILREILALERTTKNPLTKQVEEMEVEREMELAIVCKAIKGDVKAYNAVKDNTYGKLTDKLEVSNDSPQINVFFNLAVEEARRNADLPRESLVKLLQAVYPEVEPDEVLRAIDCSE